METRYTRPNGPQAHGAIVCLYGVLPREDRVKRGERIWYHGYLDYLEGVAAHCVRHGITRIVLSGGLTNEDSLDSEAESVHRLFRRLLDRQCLHQRAEHDHFDIYLENSARTTEQNIARGYDILRRLPGLLEITVFVDTYRKWTAHMITRQCCRRIPTRAQGIPRRDTNWKSSWPYQLFRAFLYWVCPQLIQKRL